MILAKQLKGLAKNNLDKQIYLNIDENNLHNVVLFLKTNSNTKFRQLIDITAVDYPENIQRYKLVYLLLSHEKNQRI